MINLYRIYFPLSFVLVMSFCHTGFSQTVAGKYTFTAVGGAYTANAAPTTIHAAAVDDMISAAINIGFTFSYGCTNFTQFKASSNGWMTLGTSISSNYAYNDLDFTTGPIIAPLWDDIETGSSGNVNYQLTGSSPNRILTVEWNQMNWDYSATTWGISFQVKLYETSNRIEFIYIRNGAAGANLVSPDASIGISGASTNDFYSLQDVTAAPVVSQVTEQDLLATKPANGQIYRWDIGQCSGTPAGGTASASPASVCPGSSSTISLSGNSTGCGITYQWQSSPNPITVWTNIAGATSASYTATPGASTNYRCVITCTISGLSANSASALVTVGAVPFAAIPYSQMFEGPWLSVCNTRDAPDNSWRTSPLTGNQSWRRQDDGVAAAAWSGTTGVYTPASSQGSYSACFNSYNASTGTQGMLDLYVDLSPAGTKSLCFDYINLGSPDPNDVMNVLLSTDGGATFPTTLLSLANTATGWEAKTVSIASTSATCVIRFRATSDFGGSGENIGIDNLSLAVPGVPSCAAYTSPANGASGITCGMNAILNWTAPPVTACNPATGYDVYFQAGVNPPTVLVSSNQTATTYNPGTLLPSTTYYWKIVPRNASGPAVGCATWSFSTGATFYASQTTPPINDGLENCTDWTLVNGAQPNIWIRGTNTSYTGSNSMYIHNGGGSDNDYDITATSTVHFYKDITFPAGSNDYSLRFYWKGMGESASYDYLRVFFAPTSVTPVAGTQVSSTYELTPYIYNQQST